MRVIHSHPPASPSTASSRRAAPAAGSPLRPSASARAPLRNGSEALYFAEQEWRRALAIPSYTMATEPLPETGKQPPPIPGSGASGGALAVAESPTCRSALQSSRGAIVAAQVLPVEQ